MHQYVSTLLSMEYRQTAVVTGGTQGIGRAIALAFLEADIDVAVIARGKEALAAIVSDTQSSRVAKLSTHRADVRSEKALKHAFNTIRKKHGRIDIVIVNAGVVHKGVVEKLSNEAFQEMLDVNIKGAFYTVRESIPFLRETQGHIVLISSANAIAPTPNLAVYAGTKSWLRNFGLSLQGEISRYGITVTIINPSLTNTRIGELTAPHGASSLMIEPEEVASAVLFCVSHRGKAVVQEIDIFRRDKWQSTDT